RSGPWPPPSAGPTSPSAFGPWHLAHCAANTSRPAATVPEPSGRPVPSGAIAEPRSRISSGLGGRPTADAGDCAGSVADAASIVSIAKMIALHLHIGHRPVRVDFPEFHSVE